MICALTGEASHRLPNAPYRLPAFSAAPSRYYGPMCGLAGSWSRRGSPADGVHLRAGLDAIRHRGPDDVGTFDWVDERTESRVDLGLVRLAILDLSQAGHQPMTDPSGRYTISFNGEITNFVELREELSALGETFASNSDTEVLLRAWSRWRSSCFDRLEGMYAFAVLDRNERTLTLARDPFGIKPLFYSTSDDRLVFNSEIRGLLASMSSRPRLDWQAAVDYLQWGVYDQTERTFVQGVSQLAPGHSMVLDVDTGILHEPRRFWNPSVKRTFSGTYDDAVEEVRALFLDSVRRNLRSDVPLGVALSGGIDSSALVGAVRHLEPDIPLHTFSYIAPGFAESEHQWIKLVAKELGAISHTVESSAADLEGDLDDLILTQGEPFGSTSIYAQYRVFKLARECGIVVTLDGQGGDEVFAGYDGYPSHRMKSLIETGHLLRARQFAREWASWPGRDVRSMWVSVAGQFVPRAYRGRVMRPTPSPLLDLGRLEERGVDTGFPRVQGRSKRGRRLVSYLHTAQTRVGLPGLLRHGDLDSMRFSIESRVPFLDRALIEFVFSLPEDWLVAPDGTSKRILRDAVRGLVPDAVVDRRDKIGFSTPQVDWLDRLGQEEVDLEHPVGFLRPGRDNTVVGGYSLGELGWGPDGYWRLINLRRWITLFDVDAG